MTLSLALACLWAILGGLLAMLPSRDNYWRLAYALIATGLPLLVYVVWQNGPLVGLVVALGAASVLRWPLRHGWRWLRGRALRWKARHD